MNNYISIDGMTTFFAKELCKLKCKHNIQTFHVIQFNDSHDNRDRHNGNIFQLRLDNNDYLWHLKWWKVVDVRYKIKRGMHFYYAYNVVQCIYNLHTEYGKCQWIISNIKLYFINNDLYEWVEMEMYKN